MTHHLSSENPAEEIPEWLLGLAGEAGFRLDNALVQSPDGSLVLRWYAWDVAWNSAVPAADSWSGFDDIRSYIEEASGVSSKSI